MILPRRPLPPLTLLRTPPLWPGARIGLMGGSFNPPHAGHRMVALTALRRLQLDRVWWVVTPGNPLKANMPAPPMADRLLTAQRLAKHPRIAVTGFEEALGTRFTVDTIAALRLRFPATRFVWIMGADGLAQFHRWRRWRDIAAAVPIAIVDRPGYRLAALASPGALGLHRQRIDERAAALLGRRKPPGWVYLGARLSALSSTALRRSLQATN